jgi:hypothetical protein
MRVMDRVEGAAIDRDFLQPPTVKRSTLNVQLKAFYLNTRSNCSVDGEDRTLRFQLAQGIIVRSTISKCARRHFCAIRSRSDGLRLRRIGWQS